MTSLIDKQRGQSAQAAAAAPVEAPLAKEKFIIISSRELTLEEKAAFHWGTLVKFSIDYRLFSIKEMIPKVSADYLFFNINEAADRQYLSEHRTELPDYYVICVKDVLEEYDEAWIKQFPDATVMKKIDARLNKEEFHNYLISFKKVHKGTSWLQRIFRCGKKDN